METAEVIDAAPFDPSKPSDPHVVPCYDPATMQLLGHVPAMSAVEVRACCVAMCHNALRSRQPFG